MIVIAAILAAIWRVVDGSEIAPKLWHLLPWVFLPVVCLTFGFIAAGGYVIATVALLAGFRGWHDFGYMRMHFTGYSALACALFGTDLIYILFGFFAGLIYPVMDRVYKNGYRLPHVGIVNNYTTYCEAVSAAVLVGGVLWLT